MTMSFIPRCFYVVSLLLAAAGETQAQIHYDTMIRGPGTEGHMSAELGAISSEFNFERSQWDTDSYLILRWAPENDLELGFRSTFALDNPHAEGMTAFFLGGMSSRLAPEGQAWTFGLLYIPGDDTFPIETEHEIGFSIGHVMARDVTHRYRALGARRIHGGLSLAFEDAYSRVESNVPAVNMTVGLQYLGDGRMWKARFRPEIQWVSFLEDFKDESVVSLMFRGEFSPPFSFPNTTSRLRLTLMRTRQQGGSTNGLHFSVEASQR